MRLLPSDPDVKTIVSRIEDGDIKLQPDFQRGEVWSDAKKRRLIDSILREWHVPPIHVVEVPETAKQEVLDGQQRLVAIRDFARGKLKVDGQTAPMHGDISRLDGLTYRELPDKWRRKFEQFTIRVFKITDYEPGEPGELFFRLNQPTNLTSAEQRNAFFGPARQQVKELVERFQNEHLSSDTIGFSNSRMAYDDVLARFCLTLELGTLREQITAQTITSKYREQEAFESTALERASEAISLLGAGIRELNAPVRLNKATLFSWLCFIAAAKQPDVGTLSPSHLGLYISEFEGNRFEVGDGHRDFLLQVYIDRATSRVADVTSVLTRDLILWIRFLEFADLLSLPIDTSHPNIRRLRPLLETKQSHDWEAMFPAISKLLSQDWGSAI